MLQPTKILSQLGLTDSEIAVYMAMCAGAGTALEIGKASGLKRPTIYYALSSLEQRGLVSKSTSHAGFTLEPIERLESLVEERSREVLKLSADVENIIPILATTSKGMNKKPTVSFYEGKDAVKAVVMETLYAQDKKLYTIAPHKNFFWSIGEDFVEMYIKERNRRSIKIKSLWEEPVSVQTFNQYYKDPDSVRILPKESKGFHSTTFIFGNKTMYVSSMKSPFAVIINSDEHAHMMKCLFEGLWSASSKHPTK